MADAGEAEVAGPYESLGGKRSYKRTGSLPGGYERKVGRPVLLHTNSIPGKLLGRFLNRPQNLVPISEEFCQQIADNGYSGAFIKSHLEFESLGDLLPGSVSHTAFIATDNRKPLSHAQLAYVARTEFPQALDALEVEQGTRIGLVLPNGPELAVALVACAVNIACAPVNPQNTEEEIVSELKSVGVSTVVVGGGDTMAASELKGGLREALEAGGLRVVELLPSAAVCGLFSLRCARRPRAVVVHMRGTGTRSGVGPLPRAPLARAEVAMVLHTSGTSGKKKVVTYTVENLAIGAALVVSSWGLRADDVGLNMMPLFHVGGIVRNLLAPVLAGGATVPCRAFDAAQFWDLLEAARVTWYYASPTMHRMILGEARPSVSSVTSVRLIGNAAGALLPALAEELRERFGGAAVLPSYGMTECMPIASPPPGYTLDRPGTSGKAVGPDLQVCDPAGRPLQAGTVGRIAVRGPPLFAGYEGDAEATAAAFLQDGWFDTGDMGYLDKDGWLYITGRSKEVINRGGEIISPFEVEQAVIAHPAIKDTIAFSAPHDVLQEVVGVVLVIHAGYPRVDLQELHRFVGERLHPAKWPVVAVYMDAVPTGAANKVQRVKLAERLAMAAVDDSQPQTARLYEAACPPKGSPLTVPILMLPIGLQDELLAAEESLSKAAGKGRLLDAGIGYMRGNAVACVVPQDEKAWSEQDGKALLEMVRGELNAYVRPRSVVVVGPTTAAALPRLKDGTVDLSALPQEAVRPKDTLASPAELAVAAAWSQVLSVPLRDIGRDADFFELGGSSLAAGRMVAHLRRQLGLALPAGIVFQHRTVGEMGEMITGLLDANAAKDKSDDPSYSGRQGDIESGFEKVFDDDEAEIAACRPKSSTSPTTLLIQLIPLVLLYPISRVSLWQLYIFYLHILRETWSVTTHVTRKGVVKVHYVPYVGIPELILAIVMIKITADIVMPLIGIALKWIIIGRFKAGRYPLWGQYYLRWFLVRQILHICHLGMFRYWKNGHIWYYRLLGAKIGRNVLLHERAKLGEWDLITIGDNAWVDHAVLRPFCLDRGSMVLRAVAVGRDCVVCQKTTLAPGTALPDRTCLPPCSSSYESLDADPRYRDYCRVGFPSPHWPMLLFVGYPIVLVGKVVRIAPWVACLFLYVSLPQFLHAISQEQLILWFGTPERLPLFLMLKVVRDCVCPFYYLSYVIWVKRNVVGKIKPGPRDRTQWSLMQLWLMKQLLPGRDLGGVAGLVGPNFGVISFIYRLLGAKVGKHVYWPGSGVYVEEFDLLEIGDDVVFGSRSEVMCCDAKSAAPVKLESGCMVADRCVILPGVTIGRNATLGSGTLAARGMSFPAGSTWVGSSKGNATLWDEGHPAAESAPTATPYARAMFERKAKNYWAWPMGMHVAFAMAMSVLVSAFHGIPIVMILGLTVHWGQPWLTGSSGGSDSTRLATLYGIMMAIGILAVITVTFFGLLIVIIAKWLIIGRRMEGRYCWDESSYNQRWQVMRRIEGLRSTGVGGKGPLSFLFGSAYLVWYFRALGCHIGKDVCLYPNSGDPMMTEPDLVTLEDEVAVDDASLVAHINSRGEFSLNRLRVGRGATLRTNSRLLSGAAMEEYSMLLEHTLVLSGDLVDAHSIWQGWPARMVRGPPRPRPEDGTVDLHAGH